jgi:hypothetical protein
VVSSITPSCNVRNSRHETAPACRCDSYLRRKTHISLAAFAFVFAFAVATAAADNFDVEIRTVAKMVGANQPQNQGHHATSKENWNYDITVENKRFQPLTELQVRYMIFYTTAELGSKEAPLQQHQSGSFSIDALRPQERKGAATTPIELNKSHIVGRRHYTNGGRIKAEDALVGIWVRVYQGGQLIGEYANPSTLSREQWQ